MTQLRAGIRHARFTYITGRLRRRGGTVDGGLLYILDLFGVAVFAISGCLRVRDKRFDWLGVLIIALVTAIGGGTLRDILIDRKIFWIADINFLVVATVAAIGMMILGRYVALSRFWLNVADTISLAIAVVLGVNTALTFATPPIAVLLGVMSGTAGGVIRDVLANETPLIFGGELYATAALVGVALFVLLEWYLRINRDLAITVSVLVILVIRYFAVRYKIGLPIFTARSPQ
jgi:uncharacterized membrane protein YeiH